MRLTSVISFLFTSDTRSVACRVLIVGFGASPFSGGSIFNSPRTKPGQERSSQQAQSLKAKLMSVCKLRFLTSLRGPESLPYMQELACCGVDKWLVFGLRGAIITIWSGSATDE